MVSIFPMERDLKQDIEAGLSVTVPRVGVIDLEAFDFNCDGVIDLEEEKMAQFAIAAYFKQRRISQRLVPVLKKHIHDATDSPVVNEREGVLALRRMMSGQTVDQDDRPLRYLQDLVINATTETLHQVEEEVRKVDELVKKKFSKRTVVISNLVVALLGMTTAFVVHFTDGNCE